MKTYYKSGSWNIICAICGRQFKADQIRKRWDGLLVCHSDYEERHSLDFIRALPERSGVPYANPEPDDTFIKVYCPFPEIAGMADIGTADCSKAGLNLHIPDTYTLAIADVAIADSCTPFEDNLL